MQATRSRLALALVSIPVVVAVVLAGIWVTGGVITNSFTVSMWLTAAWMGLAGVVCLAIARPQPAAAVARARRLRRDRRRRGRLPRLVDVPRQDGERAGRDGRAGASRRGRRTGPARAAPRNVRLRVGRFESVRHPAAGTATLIRLAKGARAHADGLRGRQRARPARLPRGGPGPQRGRGGGLRRPRGAQGQPRNQQYEIPRGTDLDRYTTAVVWCRAFSVLFARAPTRA